MRRGPCHLYRAIERILPSADPCTFSQPPPHLPVGVATIAGIQAREGKIYCAAVLDTFSRRVVGWSIDSSQTATLVTNALGMGISNRGPTPGTLIHSDSETVRAGVFGFPDRYRMETRECWCREFPVFLTLTPIDDRVSF
ncbi:DDE-type integrase/transposase/recombinase, partial [Rhodococcus qingshengii]|uniref:DDE-type integrase/transposase/recombinase n=2 Tax=Actinomycetota TaxID=201174 RepID=UPI00355794EA